MIDAAQLLTLLIGLTVFGTYFGSANATIERNTADITQLRGISTDLAAASVAGNTVDVQHTRTLDELRRRIERLEQSE
tara:strand:- start:183 stop:416 length:234 start_codon:yes stop_codon:yes gene_type:complete